MTARARRHNCNGNEGGEEREKRKEEAAEEDEGKRGLSIYGNTSAGWGPFDDGFWRIGGLDYYRHNE